VDPVLIVPVLALIAMSFAVSAAAGLGGSLLLVPTLSLALGPKQGIALAALLLAGNNVVKVIAYRQTLPWRAALPLVAATMVGAFAGARLLVAAPERLVAAAVALVLLVSLVVEFGAPTWVRRTTSPGLALGAGVTSGFSGTSGPLKGVAVRALALDRLHLVGAASLASLAGDAVKAGVFADAGLLDGTSVRLALAAVPLMLVATFAGRRFATAIGENGYRWLFWTVMAGYGIRLIAA
jgi:uncharacterized membrane protein YfcA